ncbi:helix-turn-helix domain-containing protein [Prosthecochloris sp.]|uniref:helix-turn-helix domain-containing protein n=1 Tax=Prosthecochloris sp. TaxID=290513 RepID=UPI00257E7D43|nr:helix-turn-helix domain-containing protein [Prosthecochloris sp.]
MRERGDDISLLAKHFLESFCIANNIEPLSFKPLVLDQLSRYDWPGNIRELQNIVRRSAINRTGNEINALPGFLSTDHKRPKEAPPVPEASHAEPVTVAEINHHIPEPVETSLKDAEQQAIARAYEACRGNQTKTARILGISRSSLYRKLKKYGMEKSITLSLNKTP